MIASVAPTQSANALVGKEIVEADKPDLLELLKPEQSGAEEQPEPTIKPVPPPPAPVVQPAPNPVPQQRVYVPDNQYMNFIFMKESGNNPYARNSIGCLGLGQACPGSKLLAVCPNLGDVACQKQFFTNYAVTRYRSWAGAYNAWISKHWW